MINLGRHLEAAVAALQAGELVALPTETVYGLAADARNPAAVAKIFAAKGRPADHPLIVHLPGADALEHWAREIPAAAYKLAAAFWPGPLTLILKRQPQVPDVVTGGQDTVGLRVPDHRLALALLRSFDDAQGNIGAGLAAPSANRFGRISPTTAAHVREELGEQVKVILDGGPCRVGIESTIVDFSGGQPRILRPGAIGREALEKVMGMALDQTMSATQDGDAITSTTQAEVTVPRVSGSLAAHYAPRTALRLLPAAELAQALALARQQNLRCGVLLRELLPAACEMAGKIVVMSKEADMYAHDLYAQLRYLDKQDLDLLLVEALPQEAAWQALNDRLQRAAQGSGKS